ncbi:MAG: SDR family oxidoreductase [Lachnospiraceae bacterium]|jgi:NAD(P)-dependent dehydrogenase (short-subunit alcohol dehydrogenase family)|nr:SDR family oxidoreductase [Lachnospiraceae bacterium]
MSKSKQDYTYVDANVKLSLGERLNYALGDFGYNFIYYWISAYMMIFLTDSVGIAAGAVSTLVLVMRLFDAFNDPIIGSMADRTRSRWGRYRPWILIGGIALGISVALMFAARANWSNGTKLVYMWAMYLIVTVASTCCNMPFGAMGGVITSNAGERVKLSGMRMVFANIGLQGCGVIAIPLITLVGGVAADGSYTANGYFLAVLITVIIGIPFLVWCACKTRERLQPPPTQDTIPLTKQFGCLKNKYIFICVLCNFLAGIVMYGKMTMITYYFAYVCQDAGLMTTYSLINLVGAVAGAGIGRSTAAGFAEMGARVVLMDIPQMEVALKKNVQAIKERYEAEVDYVTGDVSKPDSVDAFLEQAVEKMGTIDIVHNNAGVGLQPDNARQPYEAWCKEVNINLTGAFLVARGCAEIMKKHGHGGSIITTASMSGIIVNSGVAYASTKAGVNHMSNSLGIEYAKDGIRFNSVCYGYILSGLHEKFGFDETDPVYDGMGKATPLGRIAFLEEAVGPVLYLASDLASFQTSSTVVVDGGVCMDRMPG